MTVSDLYNSVAQLGFEDSIEYEEGFIYAVNRALLQVCALRPKTSSYLINHMPPKNLIKDASFKPIFRTDEMSFEATGAKAYYFEACGYGALYIERLNEETGEWYPIDELTFDTVVLSSYKEFIKEDGNFTDGRIRMRFSGQYAYTLRNVAMYEHILCEDESYISAYEPFVSYDISALTDDFLSLASSPIRLGESSEYLNQGYDVDDGRVILLPYDAEGVYKVTYNHKPDAVSSDTLSAVDTSVIDLDDELCALLPMLVASYIWADDEPEKAQYYLALYRERAAELAGRAATTPKPVTMKSVNGW